MHRKVRRRGGAGGIRLRLSEQMGLEVSFEGVRNTAGSSRKNHYNVCHFRIS